ncbi:hypothetical protein GCM10010230_68450 [Streptomyces narbonensis]|nr:hypothetical protein GCM10010230_68450 [Streptomyces narbonensis]
MLRACCVQAARMPWQDKFRKPHCRQIRKLRAQAARTPWQDKFR